MVVKARSVYHIVVPTIGIVVPLAVYLSVAAGGVELPFKQARAAVA